MITDVDRALLNGLGGDSYSEVSDLALISVYRERAAAEAHALGRIEGAKAMQEAAAALVAGRRSNNGMDDHYLAESIRALDPETITKGKS